MTAALTLLAIASMMLAPPGCDGAGSFGNPAEPADSGGCRVSELNEVMDRVASRSWTARKRVPFSVYVDERRCRVVVSIERITPSERRRLRAIDERIVIALVSGPIERIPRPRR